MTIKQAASWLLCRDNFIILTHMRPDGDTLCSAGALVNSLNRLGKQAFLLPNPEAAEKYASYIAKYYPPQGYSFDYVVSVDTARRSMITKGGEELGSRVDLAIDHHGSNSMYAEETCLNPDAAACGEIIFELLSELGVSLDAELAALLYIAIATDTGCFAYSNTTSRTLEIASRLVEAGAPNSILNKDFFRTKPKGLVKLEGRLMADMKFYRNGEIAVATITKKLLRDCDVSENMLENIASLPVMIEGVKVGFVIKELEADKSKVSCRTIDSVNANAICANFDGGGHKCAAGCTIAATPNVAECLLVEAAENML